MITKYCFLVRKQNILFLMSSFEDHFKHHCKTDYFRKSVTKIIRSENFMKDFITNVTFTSRIDSRVNDELRSKLPYEVNREIKQQLPNLLNQELDLSFGKYLDNHPRMIDILNDHSSKLENSLTETANEIMTKVVNEEKYNKLTDLHFKEIDRKNDERIVKIKSVFNDDLNKMKVTQNRFDDDLAMLKGWTVFLFLTTVVLGAHAVNNDNRRR